MIWQQDRENYYITYTK